MNKVTALSAALLGLSSLLLAGCDSSYHPYDGQSGFSFEPKGNAEYTLHYQARAYTKQADLTAMWHHTARELCRGGAYYHNLQSPHPGAEGSQQGPKLSGELSCLTPGLALKQRTAPDASLLAEHRPAQPALPCTRDCNTM